MQNVQIWIFSSHSSQENWLCREKWEIGAREDWRYADMRARYGKHWWWISFFAVYVVQHAMLVGISLPLYSVHASKQPWNALWDSVACAGCLLGAPLVVSLTSIERNSDRSCEKHPWLCMKTNAPCCQATR